MKRLMKIIIQIIITSAHAAGTTKAVEMGDEIGAASGLSIAVTGIITILFVIIISKFI